MSRTSPDQHRPDRGTVIVAGLKGMSTWSLRFIIVTAALALALWLLAQAWVAVLPIIMAVLVTTVMWPAAHWLRRHKWNDGLAAITVLLLSFALFVGVLALLVPSIVSQSSDFADETTRGIKHLQSWAAGPPLNLDSSTLSNGLEQAQSWLSDQSEAIASGVFSTAASAGSGVVTTALIVVLVFFFLKDGSRFLPMVRRVSGPRVGAHLTDALTRVWKTVSGFIRTQALIGLIDAVPIGLGLWLLNVPLAFTLTVLTFFAAFIPVVGALVAGGLAILIALVSNGLTTAIIVLVIVLAVQQIESNVLQPVLQSKSMDLHPGIVLLSVAAGGTIFGIVGAFLAVPIAASVMTVLRYMNEQIDLKTESRDTAGGEPSAVLGAKERKAQLKNSRREAKQNRSAKR